MRTWIISLGLCSALCSSFGEPSLASEARETPLVRAVERARASVVNIHSERTSRDTYEGGRKVNGMGTGVVVDERGYIVTNQHVVAEVDSLRVTLHDGSTFAARVISYDKKQDLAIIKIEPSRSIPVIPLGTSSDLKLGETVLAVGNPFGYEHSVTSGIISSLSRDVEVNETQSYKNLLQTDASINPGNSGGPLLNLDGEVIGINVAIRAGAQRIGFAIPIDDARRCIARLLNTRKLNETYHGLVTHDVKTPEQRKLVVDATEPNSPAATAGFQPGDVITEIGSIAVVDQADLERAFLGHSAGNPIEVSVRRNDGTTTLKIQLSSVDGAQVANRAGPVIRAKPVSNNDVPQGKSWELLGLKLDRANPTQLDRFKSRYRGGMSVVDVRPGSPAAKHGIRKGDVLVGLHIWETVKPEDIQYVLNQSKLLTGPDPVDFYVVRGQQVLYGKIKMVELEAPKQAERNPASSSSTR